MKTSTTLIAIEILTRYFGKIYSDEIIKESVETFFVIPVVIGIADIFTYYKFNSFNICFTYSEYLKRITKKDFSDITNEQFIASEKEVLTQLDYMIYNHNLTEVIEQFNNRKVKPWYQCWNRYNKPLKDWIPNE